jgi:hypothetical protein
VERSNGGEGDGDEDYDQGVRSLCLSSGAEALSRSVDGQLARGPEMTSRPCEVWGEVLDVRN